MALTWTRQPPTEPGFYWWRSTKDYGPRTPAIIDVERVEVLAGGPFLVVHLRHVTGAPLHNPGGLTVHGEWYGPLEAPL